jgi:SAM-dependent methyltransferase
VAEVASPGMGRAADGWTFQKVLVRPPTGPSSSVGQSRRLVSVRSSVRVRPRAPSGPHVGVSACTAGSSPRPASLDHEALGALSPGSGAGPCFDALVGKSFDELVHEATGVSIDGWDFSWLDGRAAEEGPSWGYQRLLAGRLAGARAALDIQTGGGEVLAGAGAENFPPTLVATEGWPPNVARATARLHPLGAVVVADPEEPPLPFGDGAFDLVTSRHPATVHWSEIARVLAPGGTYFAQHVGFGTNTEISEYFLGSAEPDRRRHHEVEADQARAAGLEVTQCRSERLRLQFFDVGAMVFFLRKVIWTVPDFSVDRYRGRLKDLHNQIERDGPFQSSMSRTLFEARKPPAG